MKQRLALLGSTGSIGQQTLDCVRAHPDELEITALTANSNWELLARQAVEFDPDCVVIADKRYYRSLCEALASQPVKVYCGQEAIEQIVANENIDTVVNALVGYAGMMPSVASIRAGKRLALANKESLVVAGDFIMKLALEHKVPILPIDSEHSAIFQSLAGECSPIYRLIITASGGPFLNTPIDQLPFVTPAQALNHPNWSMGAKITIDSSTLVNKGFEVIEAHHLFGVEAERIDVLVHPQSIVHSMVEFDDGAIKAQLGTADMHLPIQYALFYPRRLATRRERFDFASNPQLTFAEVDRHKFPALDLAYDCIRRGGNSACIMNAANEVAVAAFLDGRIRYTEIVEYIISALEQCTFVKDPSLDDYRHSDEQVRCHVGSAIGTAR